jgi:succinyl-diaminopimelate desuccinylase
VTAEPTALQICYTHKGSLFIDIRLTGEPAHASRPWDSQNALGALREGMVALEQRFPTPYTAVWRTTVTPTVVRGGDASNRLPSQVVLMLDVRYVPEDQPAAIVTAIQACFPGADIRLRRTVSPFVSDPNHPHIQRLSAVVATLTGQPAVLFSEHFATDARFYSDLGIPAVCLGPTGAGLHADDEWVDQASLGQLYHIFWQFINGTAGAVSQGA